MYIYKDAIKILALCLTFYTVKELYLAIYLHTSDLCLVINGYGEWRCDRLSRIEETSVGSLNMHL